jgi:hypothetical protein
MKLRLILAAVCAVLFASNADARPRHHFRHAPVEQSFGAPFFSLFEPPQARHRRQSAGLRRVMSEGAGRVAHGRFIHGRLVCAANVGAALAARGIRGTGSRLAKSYLHWGHASAPVPGAVAVFSRRGGGHVALVDHVQSDGTVIYLNPSSRRQAWQVGPYSRRPIAYRVAGGAW